MSEDAVSKDPYEDPYPTLTKLAEELDVPPTTFLPSYGSGIVDNNTFRDVQIKLKEQNIDMIWSGLYYARRDIDSRIFDRKIAAKESPDQSFKNAMMWKNEIDYQIRDAILFMMNALDGGRNTDYPRPGTDYPRPGRLIENKDNRVEYE